MRSWLRVGVPVAGVLALIVAAVLVSHSWNRDGGLDPLYLILAVGVIALAIPGTRRWLSEATNVKLPGGFEISRELEDAVAVTAMLPNIDEESESLGGGRKLKIVGEAWRGDPAEALGKLQGQLSMRLAWFEGEFYDGIPRPDSATIAKLRGDRLIRTYEARLLSAVSEITAAGVEREFERGGEAKEAMVRFIEESDRVISKIRVIALDRKVREMAEALGLSTIDFTDQPAGRWPDFYLFDHRRPTAPPIRVTPRIAVAKKSKMIEDVRKRLERVMPETPLDEGIQCVIVVPRTSRATAGLDTQAKVAAVKRDGLTEWLRAQMSL